MLLCNNIQNKSAHPQQEGYHIDAGAYNERGKLCNQARGKIGLKDRHEKYGCNYKAEQPQPAEKGKRLVIAEAAAAAK